MLLFLVVNCPIPRTPTNGSLGFFPHTREGSTVTYQCDDGFRPSGVFVSVCDNTAVWIPDPGNHVCTFVLGKY